MVGGNGTLAGGGGDDRRLQLLGDLDGGLSGTERAAAEPAAVIGVEFAQPAVASLAPAAVKESIDKQLEALSRKQFIRPTRSATVDQAYRFHHHLPLLQ
jgi:predicted ATPase